MPSIIAEGSGELRVARTPPAPATRFPVLPEQKEPRSRMVFPDHIGKLLDAEGGDKLHSCAVAHAKDAPARRLLCAYVPSGIALCVGGDVSQRGACRLQEKAAHGRVESVVGKAPVSVMWAVVPFMTAEPMPGEFPVV
jgi:hypothetical protein